MIGALIAKSKVTSSYDFLNRRDIKSFLANWHDESTWAYPGGISASGEFKGKKAIEEWFQKYLDQFASVKISPKWIFRLNRPLIPLHSGHRFQSKSAT